MSAFWSDTAGTVRARCPDCAHRMTLPVAWHDECLDYDADLAVWRRVFRAHVRRSRLPHWSTDICELRPGYNTE